MKKISRRAFLSVMAAAGAAAALTACGGSSGSSTAASGSASVGGSQPGGHKLTAYAWDIHSVPDHDVPTELPQLPQRPDAGSAH